MNGRRLYYRHNVRLFIALQSQCEPRDADLAYIIILEVNGGVHPVWKCGTDAIQMAIAPAKARLLLQRYALAGTHSAETTKKTSAH